jgi:hypothetical protein
MTEPTPTDRVLLMVDAIANLALGAVLLLFGLGADELLGLPASESAFYPSILGAVLVGIGIALLIARAGGAGLGIDGAIAINLVGAGVLAAWLVTTDFAIPARGLVTLWVVAVIVLVIGVVELVHRRARADGPSPTESPKHRQGGPS